MQCGVNGDFHAEIQIVYEIVAFFLRLSERKKAPLEDEMLDKIMFINVLGIVDFWHKMIFFLFYKDVYVLITCASNVCSEIGL